MIKIGLIGDVAFINHYDIEQNSTVKDLLADVAELFQSFDTVIANLESPLTTVSKTNICKSIHLKSAPSNVELLKYLNIGMVTLANNHIFDYGSKGAIDTINVLRENNIEFVGYGDSQKSILIDNERLSFHGYCCYSANASGYDRNRVSVFKPDELINGLTNNDELDIISLHWGDENNEYPRAEFLEFASEIAYKKNVVIHGHHPHVIQGFQRINDSHIAYSLGNFCFTDVYSKISKGIFAKLSDQNRITGVWSLSIESSEVVDTEFIPLKVRPNGKIEILSGEEKNRILTSVENISEAFTLSRSDYQEKRQLFAHKSQRKKELRVGWILDRLNKYYIGAVIKGQINLRKYKKVFRRIKGEESD